MIDYKLYLKRHKIDELKDIIRKYKLHTKIKLSQNKDDLINDLMKHTELVNDKIKNKPELVVDKKGDKKHIRKVNQEEVEIVRRIGKARAQLDKLKEDKFKLHYDDTYYYDGKEGNMPKKDKDLKAIKQLEEDEEKYKADLKKALDDYRKFKLG